MAIPIADRRQPFIAMLIDVFFVIVAGYGAYLGYRQGVIQVLFNGVSWFVALVLTVRYTLDMDAFLEDFFKSDSPILPFLALILTFLIAVGGLRVMVDFGSSLLKNTFEIATVDKIGGALLVSLSCLFLYSGLVWFLDESSVLSNRMKNNSFVYHYLDLFLQGFDDLMKGLIGGITDLWLQLTNVVRDAFR